MATLLLGGCNAVTDFGRFHPSDGGGVTDTGVRACTAPVVETCNGEDDDCDGTVDEDFDLMTDPDHCGACDAACGLECDAGECDFATHIEAGGGSCTIQASGGLLCWGPSGSGQIGNGFRMDRDSPTRVDIPPGRTVLDVSSGSTHTCAVLDDETVWCWGANSAFQLGNGSMLSSNLPVQVNEIGPSGDPVVEIEAGGTHTCALTTSGAIYCWGDNSLGQLGDGSTTSSNIPVEVAGIASFDSPAAELSVGSKHACIRTTEMGRVWCWGNNGTQQLGLNDSATHFSTPQLVSLADGTRFAGVTSVSAGGSHTCATEAGGNVFCWGNNLHGQIGNETTDRQGSPEWAGGDDPPWFDQVEAGFMHTCAHTRTGEIYCWGSNDSGQVGNDDPSDALKPTLIGTDYAEVAAGTSHSCARTTANVLFCWGLNSGGQVGDGTMTSTRPVPVLVTSVQ